MTGICINAFACFRGVNSMASSFKVEEESISISIQYEESEKSGSGSLKDRIKPLEYIKQNWRLIPAGIVILSCTAGIIIMVVLEHHWLALPFVPGIIGGLCLLYMAHKFRHLKSYMENNENYSDLNQQHAEQIGILQGQLEDAKVTAEKLKTNVKEFQDEIDIFKDEVDTLKDQNKDYFDTTEEQKKTIGHLQEIVTDFETQRKEHAENLKKVTTSLAELSSQSSVQNTEFGKSLSTFVQEVQSLTDENATVQETGDLLKDMLDQLTSVVNKVNVWVNDKSVEERMKNLDRIEEKERKKLEKLHDHEKKIAAAAEKLESFSQAIEDKKEELTKISKRLSTEVTGLTEAAKDYKGSAEKMEQAASKAVKHSGKVVRRLEASLDEAAAAVEKEKRREHSHRRKKKDK